VVIAGGGVAALEAMLAVHESVGPDARITLVAPEPVFTIDGEWDADRGESA
jgi:NADH dehydrogenase FAD-containing subunit